MSDSGVQSDWFATVNVDAAVSPRASFARVEQLLNKLQPSAMDCARSTATFAETGVDVRIKHVDAPGLEIDLHYTADGGGMFHPLGFEEYYRLHNEPPVEQDALEDLATMLTSTYTIEETRWRGRLVRTTVTADDPDSEHGGTMVSGWLLPPRWFLPRNQLLIRSRTVSYGVDR
jgi:hypothetical protein